MSVERSIFRSAVTGEDGEIDSGYLALYYGMVVVTTAIPLMVIGTFVQMFIDASHRFPVQDLGIGIGSVCTGFGVFAGAIGAFRMGDKPRATVSSTSGQPATTVTVNQ